MNLLQEHFNKAAILLIDKAVFYVAEYNNEITNYCRHKPYIKRTTFSIAVLKQQIKLLWCLFVIGIVVTAQNKQMPC